MKPISPEEQLEKAQRLLRSLAEAGFYGTVTFHFQGGNIPRAVVERSIKFDGQSSEEVWTDAREDP